MSGFASELLQGATLEVETILSPPIVIDLSTSIDEGEPGALLKLLRPRYTVRLGNAVLLARQPAGSPTELRRVLVVVAALALLAMFLLRRR